jgi:hypothetical protein
MLREQEKESNLRVRHARRGMYFVTSSSHTLLQLQRRIEKMARVSGFIHLFGLVFVFTL